MQPPDVKIPWRGSLTDLVTDLKSELTVRQWCDLAHLLRSDPAAEPIPLLLWCPECNERHVDRGAFETKSHHTHACQFCGHVWRPALAATRGVQFLPGFREEGAENVSLRSTTAGCRLQAPERPSEPRAGVPGAFRGEGVGTPSPPSGTVIERNYCIRCGAPIGLVRSVQRSDWVCTRPCSHLSQAEARQLRNFSLIDRALEGTGLVASELFEQAMQVVEQHWPEMGNVPRVATEPKCLYCDRVAKPYGPGHKENCPECKP